MVGDHIGEGLNLPVTASAGHETVMGGLWIHHKEESAAKSDPGSGLIAPRIASLATISFRGFQGGKDQFVCGVGHVGSPPNPTTRSQGATDE